jgi:SAM-dependent methyltransferase
MFSKITLLQMSASEMWFKDDMFDFVMSNAVFEHVQKPREVLAELFRVLQPGGGAVLFWNPFSGFRMGGHDIGMPYAYPWAHLRLSEADHIRKLGEVFGDPAAYATAFPPEHTPTAERAAVYAADPALFRSQISYDLNKMRIPEFLDYARSVGFEIVRSRPIIMDDDRKYLTPEIRAELPQYSDDELLQMFHCAVLRKPGTARKTKRRDKRGKKSLFKRLFAR